MSHEWKPKRTEPGSELVLYDLSAQGADELIDLGRRAVLAIKRTDHIVDFAVFEWAMSDSGGGNPEHTKLFHGTGPSTAGLRECRHIWWGEDGYTYYLDFAVVEAALRELRRWFDGD